jgi:hypothetical protein
MEKGMNNPVCPLSGKWYLREISIREGGQWRAQKTFEGSEYMMSFEDDRVSSIFEGKVIYHGSYWYAESAALLNLDGGKLGRECGSYKKVSEEYRVYFDEKGDLFLYGTDPNEENGGNYEMFRFVRGED